MPRIRNRELADDASDGRYDLDLAIGAVEGGPSVEQLEAAWPIRREIVMSREPACSRPWAYWAFELGEERPTEPDAQIKRLAELGRLSRDELAAIAERANEARIRLGTAREHHHGRPGEGSDQRAVELSAAIKAIGSDT